MERLCGYINRFRTDGFLPHELKVYWNAEQLEILCSNDGKQDASLSPHGPSDNDVVEVLRQFPVSERKHTGNITYVNNGIQKALFDVPEGAQIIVLSFAASGL
jgi:hypothetical protein